MMQECNSFGCPWIQDRHDENHWVCLRCGKERYISRRNDAVDVLIVVSAIALIFVLILNSKSSQSSVQTLPESYIIETYDINR